ncbi:MAG: hypothetical protein K0R03_2646 [Moraxellaceae bacterium]|nr:hypothetical protein [Moraxellaceae bacterium]
MNLMHYAFLDESGLPSLDTGKAGNSRHYVICAIKTQENCLASLIKGVESVRARHFQTGEMKSSAIGPKHANRRIRVLKDLMKLDFNYYALVIDKDALDRDGGFSFKRSFIKYFASTVCNKLFASHPNIRVLADAHGDKDFQCELSAYINEKYASDLFKDGTFEVADSKSHVLIQLADFIAGTISHIYEKKADPSVREIYRELVDSHCLSMDSWLTNATEKEIYLPNGFDDEVKDHAIRQAKIFIQKSEKSKNIEVSQQVICLRLLLVEAIFNPSGGYISTRSLVDHLKEHGFTEANEQTIRSSVISQLRDSEVIIASSGKGYKIPQTFSDMHDFVERVDSIVLPLLNRLKMARDSYKFATNGEVDLLAGTKYVGLEAILDFIEKRELLPRDKA